MPTRSSRPKVGSARIVVPPAGIEPALPKERDFESRASTSSARGATDTGLGAYHGLLKDASG
jgi:hypothetical protein